MPVTADQLKRYLDDYASVQGQPIDRFVCPLTLKECDPSELIHAHILNKRLRQASRKTVVQYGRPDHFYGSRVEPALVKFLNFEPTDDFSLFTGRPSVEVEFRNGTKYQAFQLRGNDDARKLENVFPIIELTKDGNKLLVAVKIEFDDPELQEGSKSGTVAVSVTDAFMPAHWVAGMLKAGFLALFEMIGYRAVFDPCGDTLRRSLVQYYNDDASSKDAPRYFKDFLNATKVVGTGSKPSDFKENYQSLGFDTLDDRKLFFHFTPAKIMFAATCVFKINALTVTATLPQCSHPDRVDTLWAYYGRLMQGDPDLQQIVTLGQLVGDHWEHGGPIEFHYI